MRRVFTGNHVLYYALDSIQNGLVMAQGEDIVDFGIQKTVSVEQNTTQKGVYIHKQIRNCLNFNT